MEEAEKSLFAERLKALRRQLKLTQQQVADILQLERSTYAFYETGKTTPGLETLQGLARVFGVPVDDLLTVPEPPAETEAMSGFSLHEPDPLPYETRLDNPPPGISREEMAMVLSFRKLTPLQKEKFLDFVSTLTLA